MHKNRHRIIVDKHINKILFFLLIFCFFGYPGISLSAFECISNVRNFVAVIATCNMCVELDAPVQEDMSINNIFKASPNTGKFVLNRDNTCYSFILSKSECSNNYQIAYHNNIDGLYGYLLQRIII